MVFFFYDTAETLENKVLDELSFGVKLCSKYIPDQLNELYFSKSGQLTIIKEDLCDVIHPDDVKKYDKSLVIGKFVCTDIESQYLVVKSDLITLRVLPQVFDIK